MFWLWRLIPDVVRPWHNLNAEVFVSSTTTRPARAAVRTQTLSRGTVLATAYGICVAQMAVAMPAVLIGLFQRDLGTTSAQLTWISDAFLVPITLFELTFGVLGDLFGRKRLLVLGGVLLALGELASVFTPGVGAPTGVRMAVMLGGQVIAGVGAAVLIPTTLAMVAAGTHTARSRARGIAVWAAALSLGTIVSPVLGGLLAKVPWGGDPDASWRWPFVLVAVLALAGAAISFGARNSSAPEGRSLDWPGQITIAVSMFALLFAVIQGTTLGYTHPLVITAFAVAAVFLVLFVLAEHRSPAPLLRLSLFRNRAFAVNSIITVVGMFSCFGTAYATSVRLTAIQGFSPLTTSVAFVVMGAPALILMPVVARVLRHNLRWALTGSFLCVSAGVFWMSAQSVASMSLLPVIGPLTTIGLGMAFALAAVTAVAVNTVPGTLAGMASGTTSQLRDLGFTLGPAVIGAVALGNAASAIQRKLAGDEQLHAALTAFNEAPTHVPEAQRASVEAAVAAVNSGPLGANSVPAAVPGPEGGMVPFNPLKDTAFAALDHAYSLGFAICGATALATALLAAVALRVPTKREAGALGDEMI